MPSGTLGRGWVWETGSGPGQRTAWVFNGLAFPVATDAFEYARRIKQRRAMAPAARMLLSLKRGR